MIERCTGRWLVACAVLAAAPAGAQAPGEVFRDCNVCPEMVALPGADVALGRFEVTVEEFRTFAEAVPDAAEARCTPRPDWRAPSRRNWRATGYLQTGRHPVACVSWNEAQAYLGWLSLETGQQYRLPTEAEWDRGAAGSSKGCHTSLRNDVGTCVVGSFSSPSDAGLFDMEGNLSEWTDSCWDGNCSRKVIRSSSWRTQDWRQRRDTRRWAVTDYGKNWLGFRVARTLP